jgi:hypothetical protein
MQSTTAVLFACSSQYQDKSDLRRNDFNQSETSRSNFKKQRGTSPNRPRSLQKIQALTPPHEKTGRHILLAVLVPEAEYHNIGSIKIDVNLPSQIKSERRKKAETGASRLRNWPKKSKLQDLRMLLEI